MAKYYLIAPEGVTHFRFLFGIAALSEYAFAGNAQPYEPTDSRANGKHSITESHLLPKGAISDPVLLKASLPEGIIPASGTAVIVALGIEFCQQMNGQMVRMKKEGCMKNVNVY